jgi:hypothetical protein
MIYEQRILLPLGSARKSSRGIRRSVPEKFMEHKYLRFALYSSREQFGRSQIFNLFSVRVEGNPPTRIFTVNQVENKPRFYGGRSLVEFITNIFKSVARSHIRALHTHANISDWQLEVPGSTSLYELALFRFSVLVAKHCD